MRPEAVFSHMQQKWGMARLRSLYPRLRDAAEISLQSGAFVWIEAV
jgi:hypothetical protein